MPILAVGYFGHFLGFWVILLVLDILRLFWSIKRFQGFFFWTICGFGGTLVILVILGVYQAF